MSYFFHRIALGFLLFMLLSLPSHMSAQTYINGGAVYGEWAKEDSPYHILGDITVPDSLELKISQGVVVEFHGPFKLVGITKLPAII